MAAALYPERTARLAGRVAGGEGSPAETDPLGSAKRVAAPAVERPISAPTCWTWRATFRAEIEAALVGWPGPPI